MQLSDFRLVAKPEIEALPGCFFQVPEAPKAMVAPARRSSVGPGRRRLPLLFGLESEAREDPRKVPVRF